MIVCLSIFDIAYIARNLGHFSYSIMLFNDANAHCLNIKMTIMLVLQLSTSQQKNYRSINSNRCTYGITQYTSNQTVQIYMYMNFFFVFFDNIKQINQVAAKHQLVSYVSDGIIVVHTA